MPAKTDLPVLTLPELNRALLAGQRLLTRQRIGAVEAIERLACLLDQWAPSPYVALWSRLAGFKRDDLTSPIDKGLVIKATLMRATLPLVSAKEYAAYALATLDGRFAAWRPPGGPDLAALKHIHDKVFTFAAKPRTREEIREFIARDAPKDERLRNWYLFAAVTASGIIWEKNGAHWEHRQPAPFVAPPARMRKAPTPDPAFHLVARPDLRPLPP